MTKLPLLLNAVPKVNLVGPKVYLDEGIWYIKSDNEKLSFLITLDGTEWENHLDVYKIKGGLIQARVTGFEGNERVSIYAEQGIE